MRSIPASAVLFAMMFAAASLSAEDKAAISPEDLAFFENKIRPALIEHCYECHSEQGKRKGGLWLDRKAGWETGGDSGPAAMPGDLEGSLLIESVRYLDPDTEMPPDGKLPANVIADFEEWVLRGLPDPRDEAEISREKETIDVEEGKKFWSFRPLKKDRVPEAESGGTSAIDLFVDAKLRDSGLRGGGSVNPEARLRRAKTDLTGFSPSLAEQEEFLQDPTDEKFAEFVDRWLASDEFGERWARHWLDLARYADTSGGGRALTFSEAWRFRDYVIDAFRDDKPLDQLITAHLAGDLLPHQSEGERIENLIATGFLVLGPHNYENQNKELLELEIVDEQIDTMGRAFLGMTLSCARCHDHKFDPVPTKDYYSLAGIFLSTDFVTHANVSKWHTEPIPPTKEVQEALTRFKEKEESLESQIADCKEQLAQFGVGAGGEGSSVAKASLPGIVIDNADAKLVGEWMESTSTPRWVDAGYIHDQNTDRGKKSATFVTPAIEEAGRYEVRFSYSASTNRNPAVPVTVKTKGKESTVIVNQMLNPIQDRLFHTLGEFVLEKGEQAIVTISNDTEESGVVIADAVQWIPLFGSEESRKAGELTEENHATIRRLSDELASLEKELKAHAKSRPRVPEAMSVVDRKPEEIGDTEIRIRGVDDNLGEIAPRGFLQVASFGAPNELTIGPDTSGRLELARWVTDARNPLTARVLANRIWHHLMGRGIVSSVDNFGISGEAPSHPALLDYLASRLIASGWSTKALIREIMLSRVYSRDSEVTNTLAENQDPENQLFWRAHKRAIDVEAMRDSMLQLAGVLDTSTEGSSLPDGFKSEFGYQFSTTRRSIYVPVFRNASYEMFSAFDFANPNFTVGNRSQSEIATQALFLMNSPMVHRHGGEAASELLQLPARSDAKRVELAFRRTLGRKPSPAEAKMALEFLRTEGDTPESDDADAWSALQRSLFASVDFRFLR